MEYNENIKRYRKEKNLTQEELADGLKVSRRTIVRWENGWNVPSHYYAQKMAELFETTVEELMNGESKTQTASTAEHKKRDLLTTTVWFCVLCCLPMFIHLCVYTYINANYRLRSMRGEWHTFDKYGHAAGAVYFSFLDWAQPFFEAVCLLALVYLTAWWAVKFIGIFRNTEDKFERSLLYRQWRFGIFFLTANIAYFLFETQPLWIDSMHVSPPSQIYIILGCIFTGLFLFVLCDVFFKWIMRKKMVVERNDVLDIVNDFFLIFGLGAFIFACIAVWFALISSIDAYTKCIIICCVVAGFFAVVYLSVIAIVKYVSFRRNKE